MSIERVTCGKGGECDVTFASPTTARGRLVFLSDRILQWWVDFDGNFSDTGTADTILFLESFSGPSEAPVVQELDASWQVNVSNVSVTLTTDPVLLSVALDGEVVLAEAAPLTWDSASTSQHLTRDTSRRVRDGLGQEFFFGGGMQNGRFSHRDEAITVAVDYNWDDGGHPNSVPFYLSTAGFGVLRNTWSPGVYEFTDPVTTTHNESRFDAFYLLGKEGPELESVLGLYTQLTGRPFLPPIYAFGLGAFTLTWIMICHVMSCLINKPYHLD